MPIVYFREMSVRDKGCRNQAERRGDYSKRNMGCQTAEF